MFSKSTRFYDVIYGEKDYAAEAGIINAIIQEHKQTSTNRLLDVACGTGQHLAHLRKRYDAEGLDLDSELLEIARDRCPGIVFHRADMVDFDLGEQFDTVTCLFSSIGYVKTMPRLQQAIQTLARHTKPGGVVLVEPWIGPDIWIDGYVSAILVDEPDLKIARMSVSDRTGRMSDLEFHYLVATPDGVKYFTERHEIGLFTQEEYLQAFEDAGCSVTYNPDRMPLGRGVYIGVKQK